MHSFRAYSAVKFTGSFSFLGSLTGCQALQAVYWWGDKHWPTLIKLLVWLFAILYYNSIHTHTQDAYLDQSVLVSSPHSCHRVAGTEAQSASGGRQQQQLWVSSVSICMSISCKASCKDSAGWQHTRVKGLLGGGRYCVYPIPWVKYMAWILKAVGRTEPIWTWIRLNKYLGINHKMSTYSNLSWVATIACSKWSERKLSLAQLGRKSALKQWFVQKTDLPNYKRTLKYFFFFPLNP